MLTTEKVSHRLLRPRTRHSVSTSTDSNRDSGTVGTVSGVRPYLGRSRGSREKSSTFHVVNFRRDEGWCDSYVGGGSDGPRGREREKGSEVGRHTPRGGVVQGGSPKSRPTVRVSGPQEKRMVVTREPSCPHDPDRP